jgi:hypothetical protein
MIHQAIQMLVTAGYQEPVATVLADGGYWNNVQIVT